MDAGEVEIIECLAYFSEDDVGLASSIVSLDWMQDQIGDTESRTLTELSHISSDSIDVAMSVVRLGWMRDNMSEAEVGALDWINNFDSSEVALTVTSVPWMQEEIEETGVRAIENLSHIANDDAETTLSVIALPWLQDGVDDFEIIAVVDLSYLSDRSTSLAASVIDLSWFQDGIEEMETGALDWINNFESAEVALSIVDQEWLRDGFEEAEVGAIERLSYISDDSTEAARSIIELSWVKDGIDELEADTIEDLSFITRDSPEVAMNVSALEWVVDGVEIAEVGVIEDLSYISNDDPEIVDAILSLAWMQDGVYRTELYGVSMYDPDLVGVLLDPEAVLVERRTIELPLSGEMVLSIIRTAPGASEAMDLLEYTVRGIEEYMGEPFPTNHIGLLYEDAVVGGSAGTNFGTHMTILPKYDVGYDSEEVEFPGLIVAHEVAHYYWAGNADWMDKGTAEFLATYVEHRRSDRPIVTDNKPCPYVRTIEELDVSRDDTEFTCNYSLGERLFLDLRRTLGDDRFRERFREVYLVSEDIGPGDDMDNGADIQHVRDAFSSEEGTEGKVISRWYEGTELYEFSTSDPSPVDPILHTMDGRLHGTFISIGVDGPVVYNFSAEDADDWLYLTVETSWDVSGSPREVPLTIVEYYEDGFALRHRSDELVAEKKYVGNTMWFYVGLPPGEWLLGRYFLSLYTDGVKVAEVEYRVTP